MERHSAYKAIGKPTYSTAGNAREMEILKLLSRYDVLPSDFIYHGLDNYQATRATLTKLDAGHYIGFPDLEPEEKLAYIPRNDFYVYELKPRGKALLARDGIFAKVGGNDHFLHKLLRSEVEYLLDRAPVVVKGPDDILTHPQCPRATREMAYPFRVPPKPALEPDITRGFAAGDSALFVHVEIDRGTEPKRSFQARQSLSGKITRYRQYFEGEHYKKHFGFPYAPSVLIATTRNTDDLPALIEEFAGDWKRRFFFTSVALKPLPTDNLFVPWQSADGTLDLLELLNVRHEKSGARERTGERNTGARAGA